LRRWRFYGVLKLKRPWPAGRVSQKKQQEDKTRRNEIMPTIIEDNQITAKTKELCQAILDEPNMRAIRQRIDAFMADDKTRAAYDGLVEKGQALQQKQQSATPLSNDEIIDFEKTRDSLLANPVARSFLDAQEELHNVQESIQQYVSKTLELGRVPNPDDLSGGNCGHGCGCHH